MMTEAKDTAMPANKAALSRALGAAFLSHQVEQLEKSVAQGATSGDWRDRRQKPESSPPRNGQRGIINMNHRLASPQPKPQAKPAGKKQTGELANGNALHDDNRSRRPSDPVIDVVVVDVSVLVHAIHQLKLWCRSDRKEKIIVPLEALNTLDLLKKGTNSLAQRARTASRILEAQVGVNNRIIVQQDDAYVLWGRIPFQEASIPNSSPEWVRRTICCARFEVEKARPGVKVVFAVSSPNSTPNGEKNDEHIALSPVPLPAPHPHMNKHEPRSSGALVAQWAKCAGLEVLDIKPTVSGSHEDEVDRSRRISGRKPHPHQHSTSNGDGGMVKRPPAVLAMMEMVSQPNKAVRVLARGEKLDPDP